MNNKLYYWAENLEEYSADNENGYNQVIEIRRLNLFIGKNNAGKSRFLRGLFSSSRKSNQYQVYLFRKLLAIGKELRSNDQYQDLRNSKFYNNFFLQLDNLVISMNSYAPDSPDVQFKYCLDYLRALLHKGLKDNATLIELNSSDNLGMRST